MTSNSMKALFGAGSLAVIAAVSLAPAAHAQAQQGTMYGQPGAMAPAPQPYGYATPQAPAPNGYGPQQNAYVPAQQDAAPPIELHQSNPAYPGPKIN